MAFGTEIEIINDRVKLSPIISGGIMMHSAYYNIEVVLTYDTNQNIFVVR